MKLLSLRLCQGHKIAPPGMSQNNVLAYAEHFDHPHYVIDLLDNGWVSVSRLEQTRLVPPDRVEWVTAMQADPVPVAPLSKVKR